MTDDLGPARFACCKHCVHGPGYIHQRPCKAGCNDEEENVKFRLVTKLAAVAVAGGLVLGGSIAYAASFVSVPNAGGQLTGTVYVCVNTVHENQQYVELGHPAAGNCAAGYLQYTANQPAAAPSSSSSPAAPEVNTNSESFTEGTKSSNSTGCSEPLLFAAATADSFCVNLPAGSHITATPVVTDENSSAASPVTASVTSYDSATGQVNVKFSVAPALADQIQVTYDYSS